MAGWSLPSYLAAKVQWNLVPSVPTRSTVPFKVSAVPSNTVVPLVNGAFDFAAFSFQVPSSGSAPCAIAETAARAMTAARLRTRWIVTVFAPFMSVPSEGGPTPSVESIMRPSLLPNLGNSKGIRRPAGEIDDFKIVPRSRPG